MKGIIIVLSILSRLLTLILSLSIFNSIISVSVLDTYGQSRIGPLSHPKKFVRYEKGTSLFRFEEDILALRMSNNAASGIAIRVCSNQKLLPALLSATLDPFESAAYLINNLGYKTKDIFFIRSAGCGSASSTRLSPTEIWTLGTDEPLPRNIESVAYENIRKISFGFDPHNCDKNNTDFGARKMATDMIRRQNAYGVIAGYFLRYPSNILKQRIKRAESVLGDKRVPKHRYTKILIPWHFGTSNCSETEMTYPGLFVIYTDKE